jgi:hypothetical protein
MTRRSYLIIAAATLTLAACGGAGGGGAAVNSTPPPPPPPSSPPPPPPCSGAACLQPVAIFPTIQSSTNFAALGLEAGGLTGSSTSLINSGFAVSYNAEAGVYVIDLPSSAPAGFYEDTRNTPNSRFWNGKIAEAPANVSVDASVFKPGATNPVIQLTYTTYALYGSTYLGGPFGFVAFGTPTPQSGVPVLGSASYNATVEGATLDAGDYVKGNATLQFNFAAGTLSGHFDPVIYDLLAYGEGGLSLGHYDFTNTIYSTGSTSFSGDLVQAGLSEHGSFNGLFTGPGAEELMARWTAPYTNPNTHLNSQIFGIWVGKH